MNRINTMIKEYGAVRLEIYSQYDPNHLLEDITTSNRNQAEDIFLMYSNDYVYIRPPKN